MVRYLIEEAGADPTVLFSSPPCFTDIDDDDLADDEVIHWRVQAARYLIDECGIEESALRSIGFETKERDDFDRSE
ncbi:hypothetical protein A9Z42_0048350 [Trichoderma parareesei]|uniref:Uncharacterized protein n=1 Tax=Trichoderma parareesei TaxID=858221 RepID=A0A2H2Z8Q3_TRIPA|nr:hypothetical protein A9Z42_0048350 [Trichoderma parareesei]